jgi:hypothetical protein
VGVVPPAEGSGTEKPCISRSTLVLLSPSAEESVPSSAVMDLSCTSSSSKTTQFVDVAGLIVLKVIPPQCLLHITDTSQILKAGSGHVLCKNSFLVLGNDIFSFRPVDDQWAGMNRVTTILRQAYIIFLETVKKIRNILTYYRYEH